METENHDSDPELETTTDKLSGDTVVSDRKDVVEVKDPIVCGEENSNANTDILPGDGIYPDANKDKRESLLNDENVCPMETDNEMETDRSQQVGSHDVSSESEPCYSEYDLECPICKLLFMNGDALKSHTLTHFGSVENINNEAINGGNIAEEIRFKCSLCDSTFAESFQLTNHMVSHTGKKPYGCHECEKTFPQYKSLLKHLKSHNVSLSIIHECSICRKTFTQRQALAKHEKIHTRTKSFKCTECEKTFAERTNLDKHIKMHAWKNLNHEGESSQELIGSEYNIKNDSQATVMPVKGEVVSPLACQHCGKSFDDKLNLKKHQTMWHSNEQFDEDIILNKHEKSSPNFSYKCSFCDKSYTKKLDLVCHEGIHTGERPHVCLICDKGFATRRDLSGHYRKVHPSEVCPESGKRDEVFMCADCPREFTRKCDLTQHERREHTTAECTRFQCIFCEEEFTKKSELICHEGTHTGGKPFSCLYCDERFVIKSDLKKHTKQKHPTQLDPLKKVWKKEKKERTKDTSKSSVTSKTFNCEVCGKVFTKKTDFVCHEGIHNGKRPHPCDTCGKGFKTKADLMKHENRIHSSKFKCNLCEKVFGISSDFTRHMKSHEK